MSYCKKVVKKELLKYRCIKISYFLEHVCPQRRIRGLCLGSMFLFIFERVSFVVDVILVTKMLTDSILIPIEKLAMWQATAASNRRLPYPIRYLTHTIATK